MKRVVLALVGCLLTATAAVAGQGSALPSPHGLRTQVEFWKKVFGTYSRYQVAVHDTWHLDRVYTVLDFRDSAEVMDDATLSAYIEARTREEKERIRGLLVRLHQQDGDNEGLTVEERRIHGMFRGDSDPNPFLAAAAEDRIRGQRGLRERFANGVQISRRYLPEMEAIFRRDGLPVELTRLPLVESCFNVRAYSKVGAAGVWQFMPSTGRLYLRIDDQVDERRDPIAATRAAAQLLARNYEVLGTWPLAVTAYNHGRAGMARAVDTVGSTDLVEIIRSYRGPLFKFASRNFYAEFLAAVEVERDYRSYFGELDMQRPLATDLVSVPEPTSLPILAQAARTDSETLADLNPALTPDVQRGRLLVPKGYRLQVPAGRRDDFQAGYAALLPRLKASRSPGKATARTVTKGASTQVVTHRVRPGQTLHGIARQYGTTVSAIQRRNKLQSGAALRTGQSLIIPKG